MTSKIETLIETDRLLTEEDIAKAKADAAAAVVKKLRDKELKAIRDAEIERLEQELNEDPEEEIVKVTINLVGTHDRGICINGKMFYSGETYHVKRRVASVLYEIMGNAFRQARDASGQFPGKNWMDWYRNVGQITVSI